MRSSNSGWSSPGRDRCQTQRRHSPVTVGAGDAVATGVGRRRARRRRCGRRRRHDHRTTATTAAAARDEQRGRQRAAASAGAPAGRVLAGEGRHGRDQAPAISFMRLSIDCFWIGLAKNSFSIAAPSSSGSHAVLEVADLAHRLPALEEIDASVADAEHLAVHVARLDAGEPDDQRGATCAGPARSIIARGVSSTLPRPIASTVKRVIALGAIAFAVTP